MLPLVQWHKCQHCSNFPELFFMIVTVSAAVISVFKRGSRIEDQASSDVVQLEPCIALVICLMFGSLNSPGEPQMAWLLSPSCDLSSWSVQGSKNQQAPSICLVMSGR